MKSILLVVLSLGLVFGEGDLEGYKVVSFNFTNEYQIDKALSMLGDQVDFWKGPSTRIPTDIMMPPELADWAIKAFSEMGVRHKVINHNVQASLDYVAKQMKEQKLREPTKIVGTFARYNDILTWVNALPAQYPNLVSVMDIGNTFENRPMKLITIGNKAITGKQKVFMEATIHAREHLAVASLIYIINEFLTKYGSDASITNALNKVEWNFIPVGNPDGYEYSHTDFRMWRKTRSRYSLTQTCYGVDPNRNFAYQFGGLGTSASQCSDIYRGPNAFSEVESKNIRDQLSRIQPVFYAAVHTYGPYCLYPYGYLNSEVLPPNGAEQAAFATRFASAVNSVNNVRMVAGNSGALLGAAAGASDDYAVSQGTRFGYTFELRGGCQGGFIACLSDITPSGREILAGFLEIVKTIAP